MVEFLETNPVLHMMMIESVRRGNADILYDHTDGVAIYDRIANTHMLAGANTDAARAMFDGIKISTMLTLHDEFTYAEARKRFAFPNLNICLQVVYLERSIEVFPTDIRKLDMSHFDFVRKWYHAVDDDRYITDRLKSGMMYGVYSEGELAGFMGTHEEGSLGMLEILPGFRRRGLAEALERYVIREQLSRGWTPFAQIWPDNEASLALHEKLGFVRSNESLYWLY